MVRKMLKWDITIEYVNAYMEALIDRMNRWESELQKK
jgi:hypothetical protein